MREILVAEDIHLNLLLVVSADDVVAELTCDGVSVAMRTIVAAWVDPCVRTVCVLISRMRRLMRICSAEYLVQR